MGDVNWEAMAAHWLRSEAVVEAAHRAVLDGLMRRAALEPGQRVLDIGCGTGVSLLAAAAAVGGGGQVTGVDIAPPLAARARERVPEGVEVLVGDAGAMEHERPFDAAISLFGTMFFADTPAAFATIRRAVAPGARFVFCAWGAPPRNPWFGIPRAAVEAHLGPLPKPDPAAPGPFRFADAEAVVAMLRPAGWDVTVDTEALALRPERDAEDLAEMHMILAEALMLADHDLSEEDRMAIRTNLRDGFGRLGAGAAIEVPAEVHFFTATATETAGR